MGLLYVRTGNTGTDPDFLIDDLGFTVPTGASWSLLAASSPEDAEGNSGLFTAREIRDSADLFDNIRNGNLEWSQNGSTVELADDYIADFMITQDLTDDYLNLADGRLTLPQGTDTPASGVEGEIFWETDENNIYFYDGDEWVSISNITISGLDHGDLVGLDDDDHPHYLNETRHDALPADNPHSVTFTQSVAADGGTDITVGEAETLTDGSNADALHVHDHGNLEGLDDDDHTRYLDLGGDENRNVLSGVIDANTGDILLPTTTNINGEPVIGEGQVYWQTDTDILWIYDGTQWVTISATLSGVLDHGTLIGLEDDDHPHYTEWNNTETISGLWTFSTADDDPAFIIDPDVNIPTTNVADGAVSIVDGILYTYDGTRSKWLSVDRIHLHASKSGNAKNIYLRVQDSIATSQTGYRAMRDATITAISAQTDNTETWTLEIRKNGAVSVITSLSIVAAQGGQDTTINVNLDQGDEIQFYANVSGTAIKAPIAAIELAWRK